MAVTKMMKSRSMMRKESVGMDPDGKALFESRTISSINKTMSDDDVLQFNKLIDTLVENNRYELFEKISNTLFEA